MDILIYLIFSNLHFPYLHFKSLHIQSHSSQIEIIILPVHLLYDLHVSFKLHFLCKVLLLRKTSFLFYYMLYKLSRNFQLQLSHLDQNQKF